MQWILNDKKERQQIGQKFATLRIIFFLLPRSIEKVSITEKKTTLIF